MNPKIIAVLIAVLAAIFLVIAFAIPADADPLDNYVTDVAPAVCDTLDEYPTPAGVIGVAIGVVEVTGLPPEDAGTVLGRSVVEYCPEHTQLILDTAESFDKGFVA